MPAQGALARRVAKVLRLPSTPPEAPRGDTGSRVFRAGDRYLTYRYLPVGIAAVFVLGGLTVGVVASLLAGPWQLAVVLAVTLLFVLLELALVVAVIRLDWELRYYVVTDRSLRIREGAWTVRELTLTFLNVQNVAVAQGPLERFFGISRVIVQTAGGGGAGQSQGQAVGNHQAVLRGITDPALVRDLIRVRLEAARRDAGLGDPDDGGAGADRLGEGHLALLEEIRAETALLARRLPMSQRRQA